MRPIDADVLLEKMKKRKWMFGRESDPTCLIEDAETINLWNSAKTHPEFINQIEFDGSLIYSSDYCFVLQDCYPYRNVAQYISFCGKGGWFGEGFDKLERVNYWMLVPKVCEERK